jgi:hypothetical protein
MFWLDCEGELSAAICPKAPPPLPPSPTPWRFGWIGAWLGPPRQQARREEGFLVHHRKTRIMGPSQRQELGGIVVNVRCNPSRAQFDELKAILTNCVRRGPSSQNRANHPDFRAHLAGRIAWMSALSAARGLQLGALFERISWT